MSISTILAGCTGSDPDNETSESVDDTESNDVDQENPDNKRAKIQTIEIWQNAIDDDDRMRVAASVENSGSVAAKEVVTEVTLLNEDGADVTREMNLGEIYPREQLHFELEFDINPDIVGGRTIEFDHDDMENVTQESTGVPVSLGSISACHRIRLIPSTW